MYCVSHMIKSAVRDGDSTRAEMALSQVHMGLILSRNSTEGGTFEADTEAAPYEQGEDAEVRRAIR